MRIDALRDVGALWESASESFLRALGLSVGAALRTFDIGCVRAKERELGGRCYLVSPSGSQPKAQSLAAAERAVAEGRVRLGYRCGSEQTLEGALWRTAEIARCFQEQALLIYAPIGVADYASADLRGQNRAPDRAVSRLAAAAARAGRRLRLITSSFAGPPTTIRLARLPPSEAVGVVHDSVSPGMLVGAKRYRDALSCTHVRTRIVQSPGDPATLGRAALVGPARRLFPRMEEAAASNPRVSVHEVRLPLGCHCVVYYLPALAALGDR